MNTVDATCISCGKPLRWATGTPRTCSPPCTLGWPKQVKVSPNESNESSTPAQHRSAIRVTHLKLVK